MHHQWPVSTLRVTTEENRLAISEGSTRKLDRDQIDCLSHYKSPRFHSALAEAINLHSYFKTINTEIIQY